MNETEQSTAKWVQRVIWFLAALACGGALLRAFASEKEWLERLDTTTLVYLAVAAALVIVRDLKSLAFGDYKIEFHDRLVQAEARAARAEATARTAQSVALWGVGQPGHGHAAAAETRDLAAGDPWRGAFGGQAQSRNRLLQATMTPLEGVAGLFNLRLSVVSTQPEGDPLRGEVQFFLHDTFNNDRPAVPVNAAGVAELHLVTVGAFTVGAVADGGKTKLELNLAELPDAPADFRSR